MDGSVSDEQAHIWLQQIADNGWVSLHYDNPSLNSDDQGEVSGGGYQRMKMIWTQPNNRSIWSLQDARFNGLLQTKIVYAGVWSKGHQGFLRAFTELPEPVVVLNGKGYILHSGLLAVSFG